MSVPAGCHIDFCPACFPRVPLARMRHGGRASDSGGDQTLSGALRPFHQILLSRKKDASLKLQKQNFHMGRGVDLSCLLAGRKGSSGGRSPVCPPPTRYSSNTGNSHLRTKTTASGDLCPPGATSHHREAPPTPPGTYSGLLGQPGRQHCFPSALCRAGAQKQQEIQSPKDLPAAVTHPEAGGRVSFCTSDLPPRGRPGTAKRG